MAWWMRVSNSRLTDPGEGTVEFSHIIGPGVDGFSGRKRVLWFCGMDAIPTRLSLRWPQKLVYMHSTGFT